MPRTAVLLQRSCLQHRYIRTRESSHIVERPERLRAVNVGLAAAIARFEERTHAQSKPVSTFDTNTHSTISANEDDELTKALGKLQLSTESMSSRSEPATPIPVTIVQSGVAVDILNHPAVKFIHGDIERDVYLENLKTWARDSADKVNNGDSEIPDGYPQGDLYLCPGSLDAIQGALGTVCEAVDTVMDGSQRETDGAGQAFVAIRPPGHHCGEDTPSGFCFVNNVAVAAAHAHLKHDVKRVVILDIDLHHGNGTQAIAWQINEETYRKHLEAKGGAPPVKQGLQVYYGSVHDILSYPCEDGKPELVQAASVSIHGPHGQHVENIHLQPYTSEEEFWQKLYAGPYARLLGKAQEFLDGTGGPGDDVMVFISCGFDASEHEHASMSRHQRKVPTSFYHRFTRDACIFAKQYARGRLISVLEGGYSDRALTSGTMAHLAGLLDTGDPAFAVEQSWWNAENLAALEAATKKRRGGRPSQTAPPAPWLARTLELFASIDFSHTLSPAPRAPVVPSSRTLRDRKPASKSGRPSPAVSPSKNSAVKKPQPSAAAPTSASEESDLTDASSNSRDTSSEGRVEPAPKKLPRVILKLGPTPTS